MWDGDAEDQSGEIPPLTIGESKVKGDGEFRTATIRVIAHRDATVIGVGGISGESSVEIVEFGGLEGEAAMRLGDLDLWRVVGGEEILEMTVRAKGCDDIEFELIQQYGGEVAQEWR